MSERVVADEYSSRDWGDFESYILKGSFVDRELLITNAIRKIPNSPPNTEIIWDLIEKKVNY
jgi:hypothetical protein